MENFKASLYYKNGVITREDTESIKTLDFFETVPIVSTIEGIKLGLGPVANSHQINGTIEITVTNEKLSVAYHIEPKVAEKQLREAVARFYTVS